MTELKPWVTYTFMPIMLVVIFFTVGSNDTWDSFLALLCAILYSFVGIGGLFQIVSAVILFKNLDECVDTLIEADEDSDLHERVTKASTAFADLKWYAWLFSVTILIAQISLFVYIQWTGTLILFTIMYTIFYVGMFSLMSLLKRVRTEVEGKTRGII